MKQCVFCGSKIEILCDRNLVNHCECINCGKYKITEEAYEDLPYYLERDLKGKKHLISGYIREMYNNNMSIETITTDNYQYLYKNSKVPKTIAEKFDKLILYMGRKTDYYGKEIKDLLEYPSICYAVDKDELMKIILYMQEQDLISVETMDHDFYLTPNGLERYTELYKETLYYNQCFVAMWFTEEMNNVYDNYISKAIRDLGYDSFRIDAKEHINKICDEIIAEIRKSRFLVADFTGQRGGVYYEAGFAHGLDIPVIWTCKKDDIDNLHFDIRQYNCIVWENGEELYSKLKARIGAVIY